MSLRLWVLNADQCGRDVTGSKVPAGCEGYKARATRLAPLRSVARVQHFRLYASSHAVYILSVSLQAL